jgi:hypothetical protein
MLIKQSMSAAINRRMRISDLFGSTGRRDLKIRGVAAKVPPQYANCG